MQKDHRELGRELDLFVFSDLVGSGLPLWTPKGTLLRDGLEGFVWQLRAAAGYERVDIPHLAKKELYVQSGHWDKFADDLFRITTRDGHELALKPMNCPHHTQIYARRPWSYRELPVRYANTTKVYRDEQSGELGGLTRTRGFTQDDAHVFCRFPQVGAEMKKIWQIVNTFYGAFGLKPAQVRLSFHNPTEKEKYLGSPTTWQAMEEQLRQIAREEKVSAEEAPGEAAFYGPKVDFMVRDSQHREWQVATLQLDMNMPERFNLTCVDETGQPEQIVMIHAAIMGSIERFLALLLEHTGGIFPAWLAPVQVAILPIGENHRAYAGEVLGELKALGIRAELDENNETLGKKIRTHKTQKIPYLIVLGDEEVKNKTLTVESRDEGKLANVSVADLAKIVDKSKPV